MTPTEINKAVALSSGWRVDPPDDKHKARIYPAPGQGLSFPRWKLHTFGDDIEWCDLWDRGEYIPDFYHSLDACAMFRRTLTMEEKIAYARELSSVVLGYSTSFPTHNLNYAETFIIANADAPEHCQAYLRLKGKWLETTK